MCSRSRGRSRTWLWIVSAGLACLPVTVSGQEPSDPPIGDTTTVETYPNLITGEYRGGRGFDLIRTEQGSLNISFYGLFRYLNQMPATQTFTDHLGRERPVKAKEDLNWHRTMVWLTGFFYVPEFRYNITLWSLPTTQQTLLFGNLQYQFNPGLTLGVGILPNLTARSMGGSWPYWAGSDRQMSEDFFRGGFSSGVFVGGQPLPGFVYTVSVNTNISQLGVVAANDTRDFAYSASVSWMPTTGEFGPAEDSATWSTTSSWRLASACRPGTPASPATRPTTCRRTPRRSGSPTACFRSRRGRSRMA